MKKIIIFVIVIFVFSGCSGNSNEIKELQTKNAELEKEILELKENEVLNAQLKEKMLSMESDHDNEIKEKNEKIELIEKYSMERYEYLKTDMIYYFESKEYIDSKSRVKNESSISINGIQLFMTRDEVKSVYSDDYKEKILYEEASGYVKTYWTYEDGSVFVFNPTYLVSMKFNNNEVESELGIRIDSNAIESLNVLDEKYTRYSNIYMQDNSEDIFGYYYDQKTNTNIHVLIDNDIWNYDSVKSESKITKIRVTANEWDFYN